MWEGVLKQSGEERQHSPCSHPPRAPSSPPQLSLLRICVWVLLSSPPPWGGCALTVLGFSMTEAAMTVSQLGKDLSSCLHSSCTTRRRSPGPTAAGSTSPASSSKSEQGMGGPSPPGSLSGWLVPQHTVLEQGGPCGAERTSSPPPAERQDHLSSLSQGKGRWSSRITLPRLGCKLRSFTSPLTREPFSWRCRGLNWGSSACQAGALAPILMLCSGSGCPDGSAASFHPGVSQGGH